MLSSFAPTPTVFANASCHYSQLMKAEQSATQDAYLPELERNDPGLEATLSNEITNPRMALQLK